jgi:hypothetical protein
MVGRSRSHSEERWALLPETIVRCNGLRPKVAATQPRKQSRVGRESGSPDGPAWWG